MTLKLLAMVVFCCALHAAETQKPKTLTDQQKLAVARLNGQISAQVLKGKEEIEALDAKYAQEKQSLLDLWNNIIGRTQKTIEATMRQLREEAKAPADKWELDANQEWVEKQPAPAPAPTKQ